MTNFPRWVQVAFAACAASFAGTLCVFVAALFLVGPERAEAVWSGWVQLALWLLALPLVSKFLKSDH